MKIPSSQIPQADKIDEVIRVVEAVAKGATTFQDVASQIDKVDRQGRYYRKAAEILGLIENHQNHSELTSLGREYIGASPDQRNQILRKNILSISLFQRVIVFLEKYPEGVGRKKLTNFLNEVASLGAETTAPRRVSTIISWLRSFDIIQEHKSGQLILKEQSIHTASPVLQFSDEEPLLPRASTLKEYETVSRRISGTSEGIHSFRNQAKTDRANLLHQNLVDLIAGRIRKAGAIPKCNQLIDLAAFVENQPFIFEVKSITSENARSQVRNGLSQLYEYQFLQAMSDATLILATSTALPTTDEWMIEYLEKDRKVRIIWDGDDKLYASPETRRDLRFLW